MLALTKRRYDMALTRERWNQKNQYVMNYRKFKKAIMINTMKHIQQLTAIGDKINVLGDQTI
jgi:hypothetical protein